MYSSIPLVVWQEQGYFEHQTSCAQGRTHHSLCVCAVATTKWCQVVTMFGNYTLSDFEEVDFLICFDAITIPQVYWAPQLQAMKVVEGFHYYSVATVQDKL